MLRTEMQSLNKYVQSNFDTFDVLNSLKLLDNVPLKRS